MLKFFGIGKKDKAAKKGKKDKCHATESKTGTTNRLSSSSSSESKHTPTRAPPLNVLAEAQNAADEDKSRRMPRNIEVQDLTVIEICEFFDIFLDILEGCSTVRMRIESLRRLKNLCPKLMEVTPAITSTDIDTEPFLAEFDIKGLLLVILDEAPPLRARHALALYRFCSALDQELEDEVFSCQTGFLSQLKSGVEVVDQQDGSATGTQLPSKGALGRCPDIDLVAIYHKLVGSLEYVPKASEMNEIIERTKDVLRDEPNVLTVVMPCVVVGDVHGQYYDLLHHVIAAGGPLVHPSKLGQQDPAPASASTKSQTTKEEPVNYLFLGDYVDRGPGSLRCLCLLFVAKLLSPETVFLLRGNHENCLTNRNYGFLEECHRVYPVVDGHITNTPKTAGIVLDNSASFPGSPSSGGPRGSHDSRGSDSDLLVGSPPASGGMLGQAGEMECGGGGGLGGGDWDLEEHPLWVAANSAFDCLPISAALYERKTTQRRSTSSMPTPKSEDAVGGGGGETSLDSSQKSTTRYVLRICAMHGGLSPFIENSIDGIIALNRYKTIENGALADLTWSDPIVNPNTARDTAAASASASNGPAGRLTMSLAAAMQPPTRGVTAVPTDYNHNPPHYTGAPIGFTFSARGSGHNFGEDSTCNFLSQNGLSFILRAHQCVQEGFQWAHQNRVLTVFSAPNYCGMGNKGAIVLLDAGGKPTALQYQYTDDDDAGRSAAKPVPPKGFA